METKNNTVKQKTSAAPYLVKAAIIAALYVLPNLLMPALSFGPTQIRISEGLTLLPFIFPEAVPGLFVGCMISNLLTSNVVIYDVLIGSATTVVAAFLTSKAKNKYISAIPPIIINALCVPIIFVLSISTGESALPVYISGVGSIFLSEAASVLIIGLPIITAIERLKSKKK